MASQARSVPWTTTSRVLGWVIARSREARGLSQGQLGESLGISQSAWSRIELGENALTVDGLLTVAARLGVPAPELLEQTEGHAARLTASGVRVVNERAAETTVSSGAAFLAGAALTGLIVAALMEGKKST